MYVLLDENLDWRLVRYFDDDFQVSTVSRQGWKGKQNSELLKQAATAFDVLVTMDKGFEYQQNINDYNISVIVISAKSNKLQDIQPAMPKVNQVIRDMPPGQVIHVSANTAIMREEHHAESNHTD